MSSSTTPGTALVFRVTDVIRGALAGVFAGLVTFGFARLIGEPLLDRAISFEATLASGHEAELINRTTQSGAGLALGQVGFGVGLGLVFAVVLALTTSYLPGSSALPKALWLAATGFVATSLVPWLKYPGSPPALEFVENNRERTGWWVLLLVGSVAAAAVAWWLASRRQGWRGGLTALAAYALAAAMLITLLPDLTIAPSTPAFPADLLADFRQYVLALAALMWASLGMAYGLLSRLSATRSAGQGVNHASRR